MESFIKKRKKCAKLLKEMKNEYLSKLNIKNVTDNIKFWATVEPFFSGISKTVNYII